MNIYKFREIDEASSGILYDSLMDRKNKNKNKIIINYGSNLEEIFPRSPIDRPQLDKISDIRNVQDAMKAATLDKGFTSTLRKVKRKIGLQGSKIRVFNGKAMLHASNLPPGVRLNQAGFTSLTGLSKKEKRNFKVMADYIYDGAFVGANLKKPIDILEGSHGVAWSTATSWQDITGIQPEIGEPIGKCLYINGMNTSVSSQTKSMQHIANSTQMEIIGIHNATSGITTDAKESAADKLNIGSNGAYQTLVKILFAHLKNNPQQPIYLIAHSQGGIITSRAIRKVRSKLMASGLPREKVIKKMKSIKIQTAGSAAIRYPKGPQYLHLVNTEDCIPNLTACAHLKFLNNLKRGKVVQFTVNEKAHSMNATYSRQLRNFTDLNWNQALL